MNLENKILESWLDDQTQLVMKKVTSGEGLESTDMMVLVLKIQTNHVAHMEQDLRQEMVDLRQEMVDLREDMNRRFEQVNARFEQVNARFEQVDKNMNAMIGRIDSFMKWSFGTTIAVGALVVAVLQYLG